MTLDPMALAVWHALDVCSALAGVHPGEPITVSDMAKTHRVPSRPIRPGDPVLDLIVLSDGVLILTEIRGRKPITFSHMPYPTQEGTADPDPAAVFSLEWRQTLDEVLSLALVYLHEHGTAVA